MDLTGSEESAAGVIAMRESEWKIEKGQKPVLLTYVKVFDTERTLDEL